MLILKKKVCYGYTVYNQAYAINFLSINNSFSDSKTYVFSICQNYGVDLIFQLNCNILSYKT